MASLFHVPHHQGHLNCHINCAYVQVLQGRDTYLSSLTNCSLNCMSVSRALNSFPFSKWRHKSKQHTSQTTRIYALSPPPIDCPSLFINTLSTRRIKLPFFTLLWLGSSVALLVSVPRSLQDGIEHVTGPISKIILEAPLSWHLVHWISYFTAIQLSF